MVEAERLLSLRRLTTQFVELVGQTASKYGHVALVTACRTNFASEPAEFCRLGNDSLPPLDTFLCAVEHAASIAP